MYHVKYVTLKKKKWRNNNVTKTVLAEMPQRYIFLMSLGLLTLIFSKLSLYLFSFFLFSFLTFFLFRIFSIRTIISIITLAI